MTHPICLRPLGLDGLVTIFENRGIIKKAIKSLKYRFVYDAAEELVNLVPDSALQNLPIKSNSWALYPIPLHKDRLRWRGFNQAEKLGQFVAQRLKMKIPKYIDVKGLLSFHILDLLSKKQLCGDELADIIGNKKYGKLTPGTIYPALKRLRLQKLIRYRRLGRKKVYVLTDQGKRELKVCFSSIKILFSGIKSKINRNF